MVCSLDKDKIKVVESEDKMYSYCLSFHYGKKELARFGQVNKSIAKQFDISNKVIYADVNIDAIMHFIDTAGFVAVESPRFPEVKRDLSMVLDRSVKFEALEQLAFKTESKILKRINLFDVYEGDKIASDKKSYALSFFLRDDEATLKDQQIDTVMKKLMEGFESKLGALIRKEK